MQLSLETLVKSPSDDGDGCGKPMIARMKVPAKLRKSKGIYNLLILWNIIVYSLYKYIMIKLLFVNVLQPLDVSLRLYALVMKCGLSIGMVWSRYVTVTTHQKSWEPFPPTGVGLSDSVGWGVDATTFCELADMVTVMESWLLMHCLWALSHGHCPFICHKPITLFGPCRMGISRDLDRIEFAVLRLFGELVEFFIGRASWRHWLCTEMLAFAATTSLYIDPFSW